MKDDLKEQGLSFVSLRILFEISELTLFTAKKELQAIAKEKEKPIQPPKLDPEDEARMREADSFRNSLSINDNDVTQLLSMKRSPSLEFKPTKSSKGITTKLRNEKMTC